VNIYFTYDYEIFFGNPTGTALKCIVEPTNEIRKIANETGVKFIFFVDVGYLKKLKEFSHFETVKNDYDLVVQQIKDLVNEGHNCQLHIHPHWEDSYHDGSNWTMDISRYKLVDFSESEIEEIVLSYKSILQEITQKNVDTYRAGGWCLQPFEKVKKAFEKAEIKYDSTVFFGGKNTKDNYFYDFTNCPDKDKWKFSNDLCVEDNEKGIFWEYPISNFQYSPIFFWRLFILGRLKPKMHKPIGDGFPVPSQGMRKKMLTKGMNLSASVDGYFTVKLNKILKKNQNKGFEEMVIIGHPKATTKFALKKMKAFILRNKNNHSFKSSF